MKNKIAPGHNPDKLTVEQVGKGWRLLTLSEKKACAKLLWKKTHLIQFWLPENKWRNHPILGCWGFITYRTRKPKGYWLTH